jgi:hypothetical protein
MKTRRWLIAALAILLLALIVVQLGAQKVDEPTDEAATEHVTHEYDLARLFNADHTSEAPADLAATCFFGTTDPMNIDDSEWLKWDYVRCEGPGLITEEREVLGLVEGLSNEGELESAKISYGRATQLVVSATEPLHARLGEALSYLRLLMESRVQIQIRRLDALPERLVQPKGSVIGKLIASREVANGEFALVSNVTRSSIIWTGQAETNGYVPQVADYYWGEQWGVSALIMPDGRIRMQAWHGAIADEGLREFATRAAKLQLPTALWNVTPAGAVVPNGGGLVLDTAVGAYLVTATTDAEIPNKRLDDGKTSFWNPAGAIQAGRFTGAWLLRATGELSREMDPPIFLPQGAERRELFQIIYPALPGGGSAGVLNELTEQFTGNASCIHPVMCGPLFGLYQKEVPENWDDESVQAARKVLRPLMEEISMGPKHHELRVRMLQVPRNAQLPAGVVGGKPGAADLAALAALPGVASVFDRRVSLASRQEADLVALKMENYMAGFDSWSVGGNDENIKYNTIVATHCTGVQARVVVDENGHVHAVAGWRHNSRMQTFKPVGDLAGETIERPEWKDVTLQVADAVPDGAALSTVQPVDDNSLVILIVERREEK